MSSVRTSKSDDLKFFSASQVYTHFIKNLFCLLGTANTIQTSKQVYIESILRYQYHVKSISDIPHLIGHVTRISKVLSPNFSLVVNFFMIKMVSEKLDSKVQIQMHLNKKVGGENMEQSVKAFISM